MKLVKDLAESERQKNSCYQITQILLFLLDAFILATLQSLARVQWSNFLQI